MSEYVGASPIKPRQLNDLRLLPTANDPRPTFIWSAESPRDGLITHSEFPKLLWHGETDKEITVHSKDEEADKLAHGYVLLAPTTRKADPVMDLSAQFAGLTEEEQTLILEAQKKQRIDALMAKMADLPEAALERLLASSGSSQQKRGPGRPKKEAAA